MKPKVLITAAAPPEHLEPLDGLAEIIPGPAGGLLMQREKVLARISELDGILTHGELRVDEALLKAAPRLKIVANMAAGFNNLQLDAMAHHGVWATNAPDAFVDATADATIALLLAVARRVCEGHDYVQSGQWAKDRFAPAHWDGMRLRDKTLGVIGYGRIGRAVARRAEAFGMKILVHSPSSRSEPNFLGLQEILAASDVVTLHVPLTPVTKHLLNEGNLALMKPGAILLNVSRGPVVEEAALLRALDGGRLGGAGLDVMEFEPQVPSAFLGRKNVVITPHIGGCSREGRRESRRQSANNIALVLLGKEPQQALNRPDVEAFRRRNCFSLSLGRGLG